MERVCWGSRLPGTLVAPLARSLLRPAALLHETAGQVAQLDVRVFGEGGEALERFIVGDVLVWD